MAKEKLGQPRSASSGKRPAEDPATTVGARHNPDAYQCLLRVVRRGKIPKGQRKTNTSAIIEAQLSEQAPREKRVGIPQGESRR